MPALVTEFVNLAINRDVSTADLLRHAMVVAHRLSVPELLKWIEEELEGYKDSSELPGYRILIGNVQNIEGEGGKKPIPASRAAYLDKILQAAAEERVYRSVSVIEGMLQQEDKFFGSQFPQEMNALTMQLGNFYLFRIINRSQYQGIVDVVRTGILKWALDLEKRGVIGEGMSFTQEEKKIVQEQHYHISNISQSQIQIGSIGSTQTQTNPDETNIESLHGLVQALMEYLKNSQCDNSDKLRAEVSALKALAESPKPNWEIIKATARSIKTVAEGAIGNVLAGLAQPHITTLLALAK